MEKKIASAAVKQRKSLNIEMRSDMETMLIAVLVDASNPQNNTLKKIPCEDGIAISGYVYDCVTDSYVLSCRDYRFIGLIPAYCVLKVSDNHEMKVPLTREVCAKLMDKAQKRELSRFLSEHAEGDLRLEFLQVVI